MSCDFDDFFGLEIEDMFLIGGAMGYIEEELEEEKRKQREVDDIIDPSEEDFIP